MPYSHSARALIGDNGACEDAGGVVVRQTAVHHMEQLTQEQGRVHQITRGVSLVNSYKPQTPPSSPTCE